MSSKSNDELLHYAMTHGIIMNKNVYNSKDNSVKIETVHTPFTEHPYDFPSEAFRRGVDIAPSFNYLIDKISKVLGTCRAYVLCLMSIIPSYP